MADFVVIELRVVKAGLDKNGGWLRRLETERCIRRLVTEVSNYYRYTNACVLTLF